jgi:hypothetical protein
LGGWLLPVGPVGCDQLNPRLGQFAIRRITIVGLISDQPLGEFSGKGRSKSLWDKSDFMRCSRGRVDGERTTSAVCHRRALRTLAPLGLSHAKAPCFATTKVPSMKHALRSSSPRSRRSAAAPPAPGAACRRAPIVGSDDGRSGRAGSTRASLASAPLRRIQRMPRRVKSCLWNALKGWSRRNVSGSSRRISRSPALVNPADTSWIRITPTGVSKPTPMCGRGWPTCSTHRSLKACSRFASCSSSPPRPVSILCCVNAICPRTVYSVDSCLDSFPRTHERDFAARSVSYRIMAGSGMAFAPYVCRRRDESRAQSGRSQHGLENRDNTREERSSDITGR